MFPIFKSWLNLVLKDSIKVSLISKRNDFISMQSNVPRGNNSVMCVYKCNMIDFVAKTF